MARELAQLNVARLVAPLESAQLADFVANLERINALGEASPFRDAREVAALEP